MKRKVNPDRRTWNVVRRRVLTRDKYRCQHCGRGGRLEVDHIIPISEGGAMYDMANLQTLARACHIEKTRIENRGVEHPEKLAWREYMASVLT